MAENSETGKAIDEKQARTYRLCECMELVEKYFGIAGITPERLDKLLKIVVRSKGFSDFLSDWVKTLDFENQSGTSALDGSRAPHNLPMPENVMQALKEKSSPLPDSILPIYSSPFPGYKPFAYNSPLPEVSPAYHPLAVGNFGKRKRKK